MYINTNLYINTLYISKLVKYLNISFIIHLTTFINII
jgi:hypothetical protein